MSTTIVTEVESNGHTIVVMKFEKITVEPKVIYEHYDVSVDGEVKHPRCSADDALRALGQYLHGTTRSLRAGCV